MIYERSPRFSAMESGGQGRSYYDVLGVARNVSREEIRRAYRALALQHHPDTNLGDASAEIRFREIAEAWEVLGDDEKREAYDRRTMPAAEVQKSPLDVWLSSMSATLESVVATHPQDFEARRKAAFLEFKKKIASLPPSEQQAQINRFALAMKAVVVDDLERLFAELAGLPKSLAEKELEKKLVNVSPLEQDDWRERLAQLGSRR